MPNVGPLELVTVLIIGLVIAGPRRLSDLGRSLRAGTRQFKAGITGHDDDAPAGTVLERRADAPSDATPHRET